MLMIVIPATGKSYGLNTQKQEKPVTTPHDFVFKHHGGDWRKFEAKLRALRDRAVKDSPEYRRLCAAIHQVEKHR